MFRAIESCALRFPKLQESAAARITEALLPAGGSYLEITIEAIHEGLTRNYTNYGKEGLTHKAKNNQGHPGGLESWTKPYQAPILKNHDASSVDNTIGRVEKAEWVEGSGKTKGHVALTARITNPDAIEKVLRGEYQTGSIGMDVDSAHCSICSENLMESPWGGYGHAHERGKWYIKGAKGTEAEGQWIETKQGTKGAKLAFINVGNVWAREYSMVATPSDAGSRITSAVVKEMTLGSEGQESIDLLTPAYLQESELPAELPSINADGTLKEDEKPVVTEISCAEIHHALREELEADIVATYFRLAAVAAALEAGLPAPVVTVAERKLSAGELVKFLRYLEDSNEEHESELIAQRACVLSTENAQALPDSAFALVKTVDGKTLRALPYRSAEGGLVNQDQLLVSLSRVASIPTFSAAERARATKKLIAAARKASVAAPTSSSDRLEAAQALLVDLDYRIVAGEDFVKLGQATEQVKELTEALAETKAELAQRDIESDVLVEQVTELTEAAQVSIGVHRATLVESIMALDTIEEDAREAGLAALTEMSLEALTEKLAELSSNRIIVTANAARRGLAGNDEETTNEAPEIAAETAVAALMGSKRAGREIAASINRSKK